jgi:quinol monooxygenase YgiN
MSKKQLTLFVEFRVDPKDVPAFKEAYRPVWAASATEPECLFFDVFQDPEVPGRFRFVEVWGKGREWFDTVWFLCVEFA